MGWFLLIMGGILLTRVSALMKGRRRETSPVLEKNTVGPPAFTTQPVSDSSAFSHQFGTVGMRLLMISSQEPSRSLGRLDLLKLEGLVQEKLLKEKPGFPVRNSDPSLAGGPSGTAAWTTLPMTL